MYIYAALQFSRAFRPIAWGLIAAWLGGQFVMLICKLGFTLDTSMSQPSPPVDGGCFSMGCPVPCAMPGCLPTTVSAACRNCVSLLTVFGLLARCYCYMLVLCVSVCLGCVAFFYGLPCPLCYAWLLANYCLGCLPKLRFLANCFRAACPLLLLYACPMCLRLLRLWVAYSVPNPPHPWTVGVFPGVALSLVL